jgi:prepilin-type N-terminal cleavage/methylation domain-containing protein
MKLKSTSLRARGFTLVELLVTMALFISVMTIAVGALFSAQVVNTRLEQTQAVLDGMNLATEVIVRDMRYGSNFYCDTSLPQPAPTLRKGCAYPGGGTVLIFRPQIALAGSTNQRLDRVAYYLSNGMLYKDEYPYQGSKRTFQITSSDVNISTLAFYTTGLNSTQGTSDYANASDFNQPLITLVISGVTIPRKKTIQPVSFSVETSASSRALDN